MKALPLACAVLLLACGQESPRKTAQHDGSATSNATTDPALLNTLTLLATRQEPGPEVIAAAKQKIDAGTLTLDQFIDSLVSGEEFARHVAPLMVMREYLSQTSAGAPTRYVLHQTTEPGQTEPVYHLDDKPCSRSKAVKVRPWWDLDHEVLACPDSYRPTQWMGVQHQGDLPIGCLSAPANALTIEGGGQRCGCGPNLIRCVNSSQQRLELMVSLRNELRDTIAHLVSENRPAEEIFTSNETWRDRNAEYVRISQAVESTRNAHPEELLRTLAAWPAEGKWAPREELAPGQHAGLFTSPAIVYSLLDLRQRMTVIYDVAWCARPDSVGATPQQIITINNPNLQLMSAGWEQLAAKPICTNCHARLDYGLRFFKGWPTGMERTYFDRTQQLTGTGPLYGMNIEDQRGEGPLSPQGFARLAVAQPEFKHCMAKDVGAYALGSRLTPARLAMLEKAAADRDGVSLRSLMRVALRLVADNWTGELGATTIAPRKVVATTEPTLAVSPPQRKWMEDRCQDCHDGSGVGPALSTDKVSREQAIHMVSNVAFGRMPENAPMDEPDRVAFLDAFIPELWSGDDAKAARSYFVDGFAALPAFRAEVILDLIHSRAGKSGAPWRMMEQFGRTDHAQLTTGLITISGVAAMEACRVAHSKRDEIDRCMQGALKSLKFSPAAQ